MLINIGLIFIIIAILIILSRLIIKGDNLAPKEITDTFCISYLLNEVRISFEQLLNKNIIDLNLNKTESEKREKIKSLLRKNLQNCGYGDLAAKVYVKDYIKEILLKKLSIYEETIDKTIPFHEKELLTSQDKFEILLYLYKVKFNYHGLTKLIKSHGLDEVKEIGGVKKYIITREMIDEIYDLESINLSFLDKLEILSQRIYERFKGFGAIDEIRDMKIDGVSAGVSGIPYGSGFMQENLTNSLTGNEFVAYNSIWLFFQGKTIHLQFLGFESQNELIRVCKNIYRYGNPGQLSETRGYLVNDMKDGSRVVVFRPPFSDRWAFFVRKHDSILDMNIHKIITDEGSDLVIEVLKWMVKGCLFIVITGEMGSGKTTLLKLLIQFIRNTYTIRVHEQVFELNLSLVYKDWNILTLRETDTIPGQEALDIMKKTDGTVIILGEVASHIAANWLIETSQISKMTLCSHHAQTTDDLISSLKIAQLRAGGFHNEHLAEQEVAKAINVDIHMENINGHRFISRITEIVPVNEENFPEEINAATREYYKRNTNPKSYRTVDILTFSEGRYKICNSFSDKTMDYMKGNLTKEEAIEFNGLFQTFTKGGAFAE